MSMLMRFDWVKLVKPKPLPAPQVPAAPVKGGVTASTVGVTFTKKAGDTVDSFDLQYRTGTGAWTPKNTVQSPQTLTGLTAETTYEVQVRARNKTGVSGWSASLSVTTPAA